MRKHKHGDFGGANHAMFNTNLSVSDSDRAAYEKYKRFCAGLGIQPASQAVYLGMNRPDVTQPNNIDVILLA